MERDRLTRYFFIGLLVLLSYLSFLIIAPFISYLIMGILLTYFTYPVFKKINEKVPNKGIASGLMIVIILLVLIIPTILVVKTLITQTSVALAAIDTDSSEKYSASLAAIGLEGEELEELVNNGLQRLTGFIVDSASVLLGSLAEITVGLFILFFIMYYGFKEGADAYRIIEEHIPLAKKHKTKLINDIHTVSNAVLYGQVLTAIIQGTIGGIGFLLFGIPNAVFWGFIMIILSFIPIVGTPIVFVPTGLIVMSQGNYVGGSLFLLYNLIFVMNIDNILKPKLISGKAKIHPVVILVGVLGGLSVFGFSGIVLGPLVMALLLTMLRFYTEEKSFVL